MVTYTSFFNKFRSSCLRVHYLFHTYLDYIKSEIKHGYMYCTWLKRTLLYVIKQNIGKIGIKMCINVIGYTMFYI